ncbi:Tetratricopeptide repeat-containing protein [Maridesulfovibrio ferrireducens]|uniref:Tetratricopeptide repeat-containing protein n=1 Tax=Maridesulfovibrio ferrireducens TaxID=246191 RepID=A0A1G9GYA1_9BACT|nr:tetratricopeptide repeat protein [Maridesulfovibrio ferrireducens]SDL05554.1 Tetratricopeptide repeat-containing protein [Maridesulfovibrio ferrireducens]
MPTSSFALSPEEIKELAEKTYSNAQTIPEKFVFLQKDEIIHGFTDALKGIQSLKKNPEIVSQLTKAEELLGTGKPDSMIDLLTGIAKEKETTHKGQNPETSQIYRWLGSIVFIKDLDLARETYEKCVQFGPDDIYGWLQLGHMQMETEHVSASQKSYRKMLKIQDAKALESSARQICGKNSDEAIENFLKAADIYEEHNCKHCLAEILNLAGTEQLKQEKLEEAEQNIIKSMELCTELNLMGFAALNANNLGALYQRKQDHENSINYGEKAVEFAKNSGNPILMAAFTFNLAMNLDKMGYLKKAITISEKAVEIFRKTNDTGNLESAERLYNMLLAKQKDQQEQ